MSRADKSVSEMRLPACPIPRPGDDVVWYADSRPVRGTLIGHTLNGRPVVRTGFGNSLILPSFDSLRFEDPENRRSPNWRYLPSQAQVKRPYSNELSEFQRILSQRTPPGPQYIELIEEIHKRGYEIFLVGGTVRDVVNGVPTNDVDLVTSIPLARALPLLTSMYRREPSVSHENGFVRLGGAPGTGDAFIDLKMFCHHDPGTPNAIFGADFLLDLKHRDFACNSIYYDPINKALIDPSGIGLSDAEAKTLCVVCDLTRPPFYLAQILIRFFKFMTRGFQPSPDTAELIRNSFIPSLPAMDEVIRIKYVRTQVLGKRRKEDHGQALSEFREQMIAFGAEQQWNLYIEPITNKILR